MKILIFPIFSWIQTFEREGCVFSVWNILFVMWLGVCFVFRKTSLRKNNLKHFVLFSDVLGGKFYFSGKLGKSVNLWQGRSECIGKYERIKLLFNVNVCGRYASIKGDLWISVLPSSCGCPISPFESVGDCRRVSCRRMWLAVRLTEVDGSKVGESERTVEFVIVFVWRNSLIQSHWLSLTSFNKDLSCAHKFPKE